ncbi:MAG: FliM/FliN family flagellar motor switch protein [Sandaracinaceae bacterium]|nr:FliM/FliN family flagellar motor switch protein [Sandaracinaceae bacterium]
MPREARPYPFDRLPRASAREVAERRRLARATILGDLGALAEQSKLLLGSPWTVTPEAPRWDALWPPSPDPIAGAFLAGPGSARAALVLDPALAGVLLHRALRGAGPGAPLVGRATELERGVLGYAIARLLASTPWRLAALLTSPAALRAALPERVVCWPARVGIDALQSRFEIWTGVEIAAPPAREARIGRALAGVELEVAVLAGTAVLDAATLATLVPGDIVVPDDCELVLHDGRARGAVTLRIAGSRVWGARCRWQGGEALEWVGRADTPAMPSTRARLEREKQESMKNEEQQSFLSAAGDAPVEIAVELARFELRLSELASLAPGELIVTGARIGERVALRAGKRVLAYGELVDVDGEVGVRVLETAATD